MFIEAQDYVKKELVKWFSFDNFSWIDGILPKEEEEAEDEHEEGRVDDVDQASIEDIIDVENANVIETFEIIPPSLKSSETFNEKIFFVMSLLSLCVIW